MTLEETALQQVDWLLRWQEEHGEVCDAIDDEIQRAEDAYYLAELQQDLLAEYLSRLTALNYADNTIRIYRWTIQKFLHACSGVPLEKIAATDVERYVYGLKLSARSKDQVLTVLSVFFAWLVDHKRWMAENPCLHVERPRLTERQRPAPSFEDFEAIRRQCRTLVEAVVVEFYFFTGLRLREALGLHVRDLDLSRRMVRVVKGKGEKDRVSLFPPRLQGLLQSFIADRGPDAWLFPSPLRAGVKARSHEWVNSTLRRLGQEAGLPYRLTAHLLRHGFTRMCKVRGVPLDVAAKLLGHESVLTTSKLYGRLDVSDLQTVYDRLIGG